jgi:hypothetical protein
MNSGYIPLVWLAAHWQQICGWAFLVVLLYKVIVFLVKITKAVTDIVDRANAAEHTLTKLATNHLPHMQTELEKSNEHLVGLREEISKVLKVIYPYEQS